MSSTALVRSSPSSPVAADGRVSLPALVMATGKGGLFVGLGFVAAELGDSLLRQGIGQIDAFARQGMAQAMLVKALPGLVATVVFAGLAYRSVAARAGRAEGARAAAKVAVLMGVGVAASVLRQPLGQAVDDLTSRVKTALLGPGTAQPTAAGAGDVIDMSSSDGSVKFYRGGGAPPARGGGEPVPGYQSDAKVLPRAGGDAGLDATHIWNPARMAQGEPPFNG